MRIQTIERKQFLELWHRIMYRVNTECESLIERESVRKVFYKLSLNTKEKKETNAQR